MMFEMMFLWWCEPIGDDDYALPVLNDDTFDIADTLFISALMRFNYLNHLRSY